MAPMVSIRPGPKAMRSLLRAQYSASNRSSALVNPSIGSLVSRRKIATNAAVREPIQDFPGELPPTPPPATPRRTLQERKDAIRTAKPFSEFLTDSFDRQHDYLRISITERCNLRCLYCMPEEGVPLSPPAHLLTTPEIFYLSSLFVSQGVTKIRLTGGEPTVRRDILPLMHSIGSLRSKGLKELALTTNGISLHRKLDSMVEAGLTGINLSLDTLDPFQFQIMTRRKGFDAVMKCIDRVLELKRLGANLKLKVNCVVMRGLNERDIIPFVELGREKDIEVRFIEYMPFGGNKWSKGKMISFQEMLDIIRTKYPGIQRIPGHKNDTSKTFAVPGFVGKVGFITSMTNDFCGTCNRLRITGDGNLKVCLHGNDEVSLRDLLRKDNGGDPIDQEAFERIKQIEIDRRDGRLSDETILGWGQREQELLQVIGEAVKRKAEKHADIGDLEKLQNRPMILIDSTTQSQSLRHTFSQRSPKPSIMPHGYNVSPRLPFLYPSIPASTVASACAFSTTSKRSAEVTQSSTRKESKGGSPEYRFPMPLKSTKDISKESIKAVDEEKARWAAEKRLRLKEQKMLNILRHSRDIRRENLNVSDEEARMKVGYKYKSEAAREEGNVGLRSDTEAVHRSWKHGKLTQTREKSAVKSLMMEMKNNADTPPRPLHMVLKPVEIKIRALEARIKMEKENPPGIDLGGWQAFLARATDAGVPRDTRRALWRQRKRFYNALLGLETYASLEEEPSQITSVEAAGANIPNTAQAAVKKRLRELNDQHNAQIDSLQRILDEFKLHLATYERQNVDRQPFKEDTSEQKKELLQKKQAVQARLQRLGVLWDDQSQALVQLKTPAQTYRFSKGSEENLNSTESEKNQSPPLGGRPEGSILRSDTPINDKPSASNPSLNTAQQQNLAGGEFRVMADGAKRLLENLQSEFSPMLAAAHVMPTQANPAPFSYLRDLQAQSTPMAPSTPHASVQDLQPAKEDIIPENDIPALSGIFGASMKPEPSRPRWLRSQNQQNSESAPQQGQEDEPNPSTGIETPRWKPLTMEDLRHLSEEKPYYIDKTLAINLSSPVPELQSQLLRLTELLKNSYPKIDTLPYDVWTSTSRQVLKTWTKILVAKWAVRFDDVDEIDVDFLLKEVLDDMISVHELNQKAARRMTKRFEAVFGSRSKVHSDANGTLDTDEFDAQFGSFLRDEQPESTQAELFEAGPGSPLSVHSDAESIIDDDEINTRFGNSLRNDEPEHMYETPDSTHSGPTLQEGPWQIGARKHSPAGYYYSYSPASETRIPNPSASRSIRWYSTRIHPPLPPEHPRTATQPTIPSTPAQDPPSPPPSPQTPPTLPHLTPTGTAHMVSVSLKPSTLRTAIAVGYIHFSNPTPLSLIRSNSLKKGDVLSVARIAGIMAAKATPTLVPLCHPIALEHVGVELRILDGGEGGDGEGSAKVGEGFGGVSVEAKVQCTGPTGVEMEALAAVVGAGLTVVDMCKAVDRGMRMEGVRVVLKEGGRSGTWREEGWVGGGEE